MFLCCRTVTRLGFAACLVHLALSDLDDPAKRVAQATLFLCAIGIGVADKATVQHADDTRGVLLGKLGVVRDHNDQLLFGDLTKDLHDLHAGLRVKRTRRLVGEQDIGIVDQRTRDCHALHLTARHLIGAFFDLIFQADLTQGIDGTCAAFSLGDTRERERQFDVGKHGLVGDQVIALKDEADGMVAVGIPIGVAVTLGRNAVDHKVAACVLVKTADDIEQGGFTAARRTEDRNELVFTEVDRDAVEGAHVAVAYVVVLDNVSEYEQWICLLKIVEYEYYITSFLSQCEL